MEINGTDCCTYLLRCADGSLYCGWTSNMARRLKAHNRGQGAKYTRSRLPVTLVYLEAWPTPREARQREARIKRMTRQQKEALIRHGAGGIKEPL